MDQAVFEITPALAPPAGVTSNFDHPENISSIIRLTLGLCVGSSSMFVILRTWTRFLIQKRHGLEDYFMIVAWLGYIVYVVLGFEAMKFGSGVHQWNVRLSQFFVFLKLANVLEVIYNPLIFVTKLSILLQFKRIFCPLRTGWTHRIIWSLIVFNAAFYLVVMILQILACSPRERIWHPYIPGKCLDLAPIRISGAIVNIISDFSILILPIFEVWQLQLSPAKKLGVSSIFATGLFGCLSSILRLVNNLRFAHTQDVTWDLTPVALWTEAEITCGIICGCLPTIPFFFRHAAPRIKSSLLSLGGGKTTAKSNATEPNPELRFAQGPYIELHPQDAFHSRVPLARH